MDIIELRMLFDGIQQIHRFPNDYGADVVRHSFSYGGKEGLWELAVLQFDGPNDDDGHLCYDTPLTDDVLGGLRMDEVEAHIATIRGYKKDEYTCVKGDDLS